jgi:MFS family permease
VPGFDPQEGDRISPVPPVGEPDRWRRLVRLAAMDIGPLRRRRDFRLLFVGQGLSFFGSMLTYVAIPFQAYDLTGSTLVLGLLAAVELPPILVAAFVGGALADAVDRRRLVQLAEAGLMLCTALLLVNALLPEPRLWVLFVLGAVMAGLIGIQRPPLEAMEPRLVPPEELAAASALGSFRMNVGMVAGPPVGGVLIATLGLPAAFAIDLVTFTASLVILNLMRAMPPPPEGARPSLRGILEGVRYARSRPELLGTYGVDFIAMFFGMPMALYPAFAAEFGGAEVLGVLYAAPSAGALLATLTSGWTGRVHRHGLAVIVAAIGWGVGITALGLAPSLWLACVALGFAGACDMVSGIFRSVIWNQTIPDHLRGRLAGIEQVSYSSGPLLGDLEAGIVAAIAGVRTSIVSGGVLCIAGVAVFALALPAFRRYDARAHGVPGGTGVTSSASPG